MIRLLVQLKWNTIRILQVFSSKTFHQGPLKFKTMHTLISKLHLPYTTTMWEENRYPTMKTPHSSNIEILLWEEEWYPPSIINHINFHPPIYTMLCTLNSRQSKKLDIRMRWKKTIWLLWSKTIKVKTKSFLRRSKSSNRKYHSVAVKRTSNRDSTMRSQNRMSIDLPWPLRLREPYLHIIWCISKQISEDSSKSLWIPLHLLIICCKIMWYPHLILPLKAPQMVTIKAIMNRLDPIKNSIMLNFSNKDHRVLGSQWSITKTSSHKTITQTELWSDEFYIIINKILMIVRF